MSDGEDLQRGEKKEISNSEPGASKYGNFVNYYQFHSAEERVLQLPRGVLSTYGSSTSSSDNRKFVALDIGCNSGDLTLRLYNFLKQELPEREISILGIDLDPILIERAQETKEAQANPESEIHFKHLDFCSTEREKVLSDYLGKITSTGFDAVFCFSLTMWIHLNHGDSGLVKFLRDVCSISQGFVVVEPQPWKCYRNASRRLRKAKAGEFPLLNGLELKGNMESHIDNIVEKECKFERVAVTDENEWQRKIIIYRKSGSAIR